MDDLIDRQAALKKMCEMCYYYTSQDFVCRKCNVYELLAEQPTIEAEPVIHGRWETWGYVFHGIEWKRCSHCGKCADVSYYGLLDGEIKMSTPAICGGCGAKMDLHTPTEAQIDNSDSVIIGGAKNAKTKP